MTTKLHVWWRHVCKMTLWNTPERAVWLYEAFWRIEVDCGTYRRIQEDCVEHIETFQYLLTYTFEVYRFRFFDTHVWGSSSCRCGAQCVSLGCVWTELPSCVVARLYWQHLLPTFELRWRQSNFCQFCVNDNISVLACIIRRSVERAAVGCPKFQQWMFQFW